MSLRWLSGRDECRLYGTHRWVMTSWRGDLGDRTGAEVTVKCKRCGITASLREEDNR